MSEGIPVWQDEIYSSVWAFKWWLYTKLTVSRHCHSNIAIDALGRDRVVIRQGDMGVNFCFGEVAKIEV